MSNEKFEYTVSVSKIPKDGRQPRFWALCELAKLAGDCLFNETSCVEGPDTLAYTFKGIKQAPEAPKPGGVEKPKAKPKKAAKKKMSLLERLAK